jgi:hypothetical protein
MVQQKSGRRSSADGLAGRTPGRLFGIKVGPVWIVYPEDLESFSRLRRPRGRPRNGEARPRGEAERRDRIDHQSGPMMPS